MIQLYQIAIYEVKFLNFIDCNILSYKNTNLNYNTYFTIFVSVGNIVPSRRIIIMITIINTVKSKFD